MEYKFATREELSVEETVQAVISELEEYTGWKYVKSQRRLKKKVKDIELSILYNAKRTIGDLQE